MANSTTTSALQSLSDYWQIIFAFLLAVFSIVVADMLLKWYRKRRDRPKIIITPAVRAFEEGLILTADVRNFGRTPLLDCANKVVVYAPQLIVEGKLAQIVEKDADIRRMKWNALREEEERGDYEEDLYPFPPDSLFMPLGGVWRQGEGLSIGFFDKPDPFILAAQSMSFSLSKTEAKPTKDLHIAFLIWIRGKTTFNDFVSKRSLILLKIPNLGDFQKADFSKAVIFETDFEDKRVASAMKSKGLSLEPSAQSEPISLPSVPYKEEVGPSTESSQRDETFG